MEVKNDTYNPKQGNIQGSANLNPGDSQGSTRPNPGNAHGSANPNPGNARGSANPNPSNAQGSAVRSPQKKSRKSTLKGLISGTFITEKLILNNMRYVALVVVLAIFFIANRFQAERIQREVVVLEQEVRDLRAESLSVSAELGGVSRQSEIYDLVKQRGLGLEELREPPYRIVVNE